MSWIKEANKLGRYDITYNGWRIYVIREPRHEEKIGKLKGMDGFWRQTIFHPGYYIAVNNKRETIEVEGRDNMIAAIEIEQLKNRYK